MAFLQGFGAFLPERVVTNAELASRLEDRTADWIENVCGVRERRWAGANESVEDLAVAAAQDCLDRCHVPVSQIGLLIVASGSASRGFPGPAAEVAARLGLSTVAALDVPVASAGSIIGLALARRMTVDAGDVLVVAAEKMSAILEAAPLDPNTAILFGDGAGAALVTARPGPWKILDAVLHSDGQFRDKLSYDEVVRYK